LVSCIYIAYYTSWFKQYTYNIIMYNDWPYLVLTLFCCKAAESWETEQFLFYVADYNVKNMNKTIVACCTAMLNLAFFWQRSRSLPDIQFGETLLEELGIDRSIKKDILAQHEIDILKRQMARQKVQVTTWKRESDCWILWVFFNWNPLFCHNCMEC
jgi:hypothetical protein